MAAFCGRPRPSASTMQAILEAVPIDMQCPAERDIQVSDSLNSARLMVPAFTSSLKRHTSVPDPISAPRNFPFNIGPPDEGATVKEIAEAVQRQAAPATPIRYTGGNKGWVGDVPKFRYSIEKLKRLGWSPQLTSGQAVERAVGEVHAEFQQSVACSS